MSNQSIDRDLKKGSAELLVLSLLEGRQRHGYEISKLIETRSKGAVRFRVASLYPLLYRLEDRGYIQGRWVEKDGERRKRYYRLTAAGRKVLHDRRSRWETFVEAIRQITTTENA
jgi:transcriptional regulator